MQFVLLASARHGAGKPQFGPPWAEDGRTYTSFSLLIPKERFDPIDTTWLKPELQTSHRHLPHPAPSALPLSLLKLPSCHPKHSHHPCPRNRVPPTARP